ncbi:galactokinase [Thermosipho atlanticus]|uniref:Galactokinase n=1 Tax=Thermosipho atlanticus DSM 15807 TaxID=1123380 RepID=A0A1M5QVM0_9BACT|nr:galactokinase [Thermosipho atlanticus]SHH17583.1 galactokinase [Thermosipho atlanticus DSM 15807]
MRVRAPGRINIIGEHTDYNDGYVLPFAIDRYVNLTIETSNNFVFYSKNLDSKVILDEIVKTGKWADYVIGVISTLTKRGYKIPPIKIEVESSIPIGSGLSSSAALEVATTFAISEFFDLNLSKLEIVNIAREAETNFVGVKCGIMDQFASVFSKKNYAIFLDTMTLDYRYIPINLKDYEFYLIDSNVKHELATSKYNERRQECEEILRKLNKRSFREVTNNDLFLLDGVLKKRAQHVLEENERVLKIIEAFQTKDLFKVGQLLFESHESLKSLYEVSCNETDFIVDFLKNKENILGARMVGGGFGGGVMVLVRKDSFEKIGKELFEKYFNRFGRKLDFYKLHSSNGVELV